MALTASSFTMLVGTKRDEGISGLVYGSAAEAWIEFESRDTIGDALFTLAGVSGQIVSIFTVVEDSLGGTKPDSSWTLTVKDSSGRTIMSRTMTDESEEVTLVKIVDGTLSFNATGMGSGARRARVGVTIH